jgi:phosphate transport system substrate-binding protein
MYASGRFFHQIGWLCLALLTASANAATPLQVGGTGAANAILEKLIAAYHHAGPARQIEIVKPPLGSSAGIRAVAAGFLDLSISGRPLKPDEAQSLTAHELARSPLAFVVNGMVGRQQINRDDLINIYAGKMTRWEDGTPLRLVLRPASDADTTIVRNLAPEIDRAVADALARPGMAVATHDMENAEILMRAKGVFGTLTLCQLRAQGLALQPLAFDGVAPTLKAMASGAYPIYKPLILVTRSKPTAAVEHFVKFLFSTKARQIMMAHACQPAADYPG